jgi:hypothetical protein
MKNIAIAFLFVLLISGLNLHAQKAVSGEKHGRTLNTGFGMSYYAYVGQSIPVASINYEFYSERNFTMAPFFCVYAYEKAYYFLGNYNYHEFVIPFGVKGTYYFDSLLRAGHHWDFYLAGSLGYSIAYSHWDEGYTGRKDVYEGAYPIFYEIHIGTEYRFTEDIGIYIDASSGASTLGLAIHF